MAYFNKHYHDPGTEPGTLVAKSEPGQPPSLHLIDYTDDHLEETRLKSVTDCRDYLLRETKTWIQVNGQLDPETLRNLGELLDLPSIIPYFV